jgi:hypothetical protein
MKKIAAAIAAAAAFAIPAAAASAHPRACSTNYPDTTMSLNVDNANCRAAQAVERYWMFHEVLGPVRVDGHVWRPAYTGIYGPDRNGHSHFKFVSDHAIVWLTTWQPTM